MVQRSAESYASISIETVAKLTRCEVAEAEAWTKRADFPRPIMHTSAGYLYDRKSVEKWLLEHDLKGLPIPPAP
jgi:hypothetical protein